MYWCIYSMHWKRLIKVKDNGYQYYCNICSMREVKRNVYEKNNVFLCVFFFFRSKWNSYRTRRLILSKQQNLAILSTWLQSLSGGGQDLWYLIAISSNPSIQIWWREALMLNLTSFDKSIFFLLVSIHQVPFENLA